MDVVVWTTDVADWLPRGRLEIVTEAIETPLGGILLFHDRLDGWLERTTAPTGLDRARRFAPHWVAGGSVGLCQAPSRSLYPMGVPDGRYGSAPERWGESTRLRGASRAPDSP